MKNPKSRRPDAVEAHLAEDGRTILVEAFAGDHSVGLWAIDLTHHRPGFSREKLQQKALRYMRRAFGARMNDSMAAWLRRQGRAIDAGKEI